MVKINHMDGVSRYRINPYGATVIAQHEISPAFATSAMPGRERRPLQARSPPPMAPPLTQSVIAPLVAAPKPTPMARIEEAANVQMNSEVAAMHSTHYAVIKFKHDYAYFVAPFKVSIGDLVALEGDRGENLGTVEEITTSKPECPVTQRIVRHANQKDRDHLATLRRKEAAATKSCQDIAESVGLSIRVVDTEYQYDMNKLTIFFASKVPVDFRKLQRELFREFRCRIWIVNWPRKPLHLTSH